MNTELEQGLTRIVASTRAEWGIYAKLLATGEEITLDADRPMETMSVIKVPILTALYRGVDAGSLDLSSRITLGPEHRRPGTGVLHLLEDGLQLTLADAAALMISVSDNSATDLCLDAAGGRDAVNDAMQHLGLDRIEVCGSTLDWFRALGTSLDPALGQAEPGELYRRGPWSSGSSIDPWVAADARERFHFTAGRCFGRAPARQIGRLLELIYKAECASVESCQTMLKLLRAQQFNSRIPRYLLTARVAHKTGDFEPFVANDAGIIEPWGKSPIVAVFFATHHRGYWAAVEDAIARMSELIWRYAVTTT